MTIKITVIQRKTLKHDEPDTWPYTISHISEMLLMKLHTFLAEIYYLNSLQIQSAMTMLQDQAARPDGGCCLAAGDSTAPVPCTPQPEAA